MANVRTAFVAVAASLLASRSSAQSFGQQGIPQLCGTFGDQDMCRTDEVFSYKTQFDFSGLTSGVMSLNKNSFSDTKCQNKGLTINAAGNWQDLGPMYPMNVGGAQTNNTRKIYVNITFWQVTPWDDKTTAELNDATNGCPCGDTWTTGEPRELTYCQPAQNGIQGTCPDVNGLFGGSLGDTKKGTGIGIPMFGLALSNVVDGTPNGLTLGRWDIVPEDGFNNDVDSAQPAQFISEGAGTNDVQCAAPETKDNYCGRFVQPCSPKLDTYDPSDNSMQSFTSVFEYCGAQGDPTLALASFGWFVKNYTLYDDEACQPDLKRISYTEEGTFGSGGVDINDELSYQFEKWAGSITVTPWVDDAALNLQTNCPCGSDSSWLAGVARRLTTCVGTCSSAAWYSNATVGMQQFGAVRRLTNNEELDQLQFSASFDGAMPDPAPLLSTSELSYTVDQDAGCPFDNPQADVCGTWQQTCVTGGFFNSDQSAELMLTGQGEMDGEAVMYKVFYTADEGCSPNPINYTNGNEQLIIEATGFYSRQLVQETHEGILFNFRTLFVTAFDTGDMVDALNDDTNGCRCGQEWKAGVRRQMPPTCPAGSCPFGTQIFGGGTLGSPGYGIFQRVNDKLQLSPLRGNESDGIFPGGRFDITSFPYDIGAECEVEQPSYLLCGQWEMPCQADPVDDFTQSFSYDTTNIKNQKKNPYSLNRTDYAPGGGCDTSPILLITQSGMLEQTGAQTEVDHGVAVMLEPSTMIITPKSDDIRNRLNEVCPCGGNWQTDVSRSFTGGCAAGTCDDVSWLRQPIGVPAYGSIRRMGEALRMTMFNETISGYKTDLLPFDYAFTLLTEQPQCGGDPNPGPVPSPPTPSPPTPPSPPSKGGSKKKMGSGDVFILLVFLFSAFYLIGGMMLNYTQSGGSNGGTPTIPHVEFWRQFPGLVSAGIDFTFCQMCGTKSGGKYQRFGGMENTYGSL